MPTHLSGGQAGEEIAGVAPDVLFRESGPHLTHKIQHGGLVGGVEGLAPQEGETFDIGLFQRLEDLTGLGLGEGLGLLLRPALHPGLRVEALRAGVGAAGDKQGNPDARPVGHIDGTDVSVVHGKTPGFLN